MKISEFKTFLVFVILCIPLLAYSEGGHDMHSMTMDENGMVMNENRDNIPPGCEGMVSDASFEVVADHLNSGEFPGTVFSFEPRLFQVEPCARISVSFENRDQIRHQWMVHGLPKFIYPAGMFHLEALAGKTVSGVFIVPAEDKTYLVHCDISQHMQKGMKGMLIVGKGSGKIAGIPGETGHFFSGEKGLVSTTLVFFVFVFILGIAFISRRFR